MRLLSRPALAVLSAAVIMPTAVIVPAQASPAASPASLTVAPRGAIASDSTRPAEARRVDRVPTPTLRWYKCYGHAECATAKLPMDYDRPRGRKTEVALLRVKAKDQAHRIGSLFLNPGGPGGSGTQIAYSAPYFLDRTLLDRFDIVGFDPRGTNFSDQVQCFRGNAAQSKALRGLVNVAFPWTSTEKQAAVRSAQRVGQACSTTGRPLSASMSTTEVARDMDVLRRAVGDRRLSYLGFSYGSYLGQVYANMFPDRVRAVAIDGVLDPIAWRGTKATASRPQTDRLRSADGAYQALHRILVLCDQAGRRRCAFAPGNPVANYDLVAERLKANPLRFEDEFDGEVYTFTYADLVASTLSALYGPWGYEEIAQNLAALMEMTDPDAQTGPDQPAERAAARSLISSLEAQERRLAQRPGWDFPYDNFFEAFSSVLCTDGRNPRNAGAWPRYAARADQRAKYFGALWTWSSVQCARSTWTARDEDAYRGPFTRRTSTPVLVVGAKWDPATNYDGAVRAASLLPRSRLLSSNNWGHTSYGSSRCVNRAMDRYLLARTLPARGAVCRGDMQPFEVGPEEMRRDSQTRPPVVPPYLRPAQW